MSSFPEVKSGKLMHIDELGDWHGDEVHGNSIRVLGRVVKIDIPNASVDIEYHNARLRVCTSLLDGVSLTNNDDEGGLGLRLGVLFQFLGELERELNGQMILKARLCRSMATLDTDMYDRCLRIRRDFEHRLLKNYTDNTKERN